MGVGQGRFLDWLITSTSAKARIILLVAAAMLAFAANSLLARLALGAGSADAAGYTGLRLLSGAAAFGLLIRLRHQDWRIGGSWTAATALFGYALLFSLAYLMLGAATGALILFASVQLGLLAWAIINRDRPGALEWLGHYGRGRVARLSRRPRPLRSITAWRRPDGWSRILLGGLYNPR